MFTFELTDVDCMIGKTRTTSWEGHVGVYPYVRLVSVFSPWTWRCKVTLMRYSRSWETLSIHSKTATLIQGEGELGEPKFWMSQKMVEK